MQTARRRTAASHGSASRRKAERASAATHSAQAPAGRCSPVTRAASRARARRSGAPAAAREASSASSSAARGLTENLDSIDAFELDRRLCRAAALERGRLARLGPLLLELAETGSERELGFRSLDAWARERLGMSPRRAFGLLRLERAFRTAPVLGEAWHAGRLGVSQAHTLVPLVALDGAERFHPAWLERAEQVTVRRLDDDVDHAIATHDPDPEHLPALPAPPVPAGLPIGAQPKSPEEGDVPAGELLPAPDERTTWRVNVPAAVARLFRACLATVELRIERKARRPLHAHHVEYRSAGGSNALANLVTLCAAHHQRGVHSGRIRISGRAPAGLRFEMPLGTWAAGDVMLLPCSS